MSSQSCPVDNAQIAVAETRGAGHDTKSDVVQMDYVVYGKIIVDTIRRKDGVVEHEVLGGGGPQGALGARVWSPSVGLLTRVGRELEEKPTSMLHSAGVDLQGMAAFPEHETPHGGMEYDEDEYMRPRSTLVADIERLRRQLQAILRERVPIPAAYQHPRVIHLITEFFDEPMFLDALALKAAGAIFSVEPIIDHREWTNSRQLLEVMPQIDIVSPDWPSASGMAGSDDPTAVLRYWSGLGAGVVAIRHGARGSYVWDRETGRSWHVPPAAVAHVVDPTGAGNAYGGGLAVGWDRSRDGRIAACYGATSASFMIECVGMPPMSAALEEEARRRLDLLLASVRPL